MTGFLFLVMIVAGAWFFARQEKLRGEIYELRSAMGALERQLENARESQVETATDVEPVAEPEAAREPEPEPEEGPRRTTVAYVTSRSDSETEEVTPPVEPTPEPEPVDEPEPVAAAAPWKSLDFEDIFGRRLPIWAGGIALAIAGIFLVRYTIEAGLITPAVRTLASFVFGVALIAGAEAAYRFEHVVRDERVRQALAGAGIATLFGAFYLAGSGYGLIGAGAAFLGLAIVTAAAIALSFRFGLPCAILGLLGGFAAPLMVESDGANIPLLALYLALVTGGLAWTGEKQGRRWLGYAALAAGLGWGLFMQMIGLESGSDFVALGVYLVVLGTALPAFLYREGGPSIPQLAAAAIATLQMAVLVSNAGFDLLTWGQYLLISGALAVLGWKYRALRPASAVGALIGAFLLVLWWKADATAFLIVTIPFTLIYAGVPLVYLMRREASLIETSMLAAVPVAVGFAGWLRFGNWDGDAVQVALSAGMAALASLPLHGAAIRLRQDDALSLRGDLPVFTSAFVLVFAAGLLVTPMWSAPVLASALALVTLPLLWKRAGMVALVLAWGAIATSLLALLVTPDFEAEILRLGGGGAFDPLVLAALRWAACAIPLLAMGALRPDPVSRLVADGAAAFIVYGAAAQLVPAPALAWLAALAGAAILWWRAERYAGWAMLAVVALVWTFAPVAGWLEAAVMTLFSTPFLSGDAIAPLDLAKRVAPFIAISALAAWRLPEALRIARPALVIAAGLFAVIAVHSLFKLVWDIGSMLRFEQFGYGERTTWQALLVLAAYSAARVLPSGVANPARAILVTAALAHFVWFSLVLHNPLIAVQHVGPTPLFNWLLAAYATAIAGLILVRADVEALSAKARPAVDVAIMVLIALLSVSQLRQTFAGTDLTSAPIEQTESLLLSLLGIALALAFLWWGSRSGERTWRIGSLVLMLVAVCKVFLIDAAGLEGLLRVFSFMALGFSLIGIGWVYTRQLSRRTVFPDTGHTQEGDTAS